MIRKCKPSGEESLFILYNGTSQSKIDAVKLCLASVKKEKFIESIVESCNGQFHVVFSSGTIVLFEPNNYYVCEGNFSGKYIKQYSPTEFSNKYWECE